MEKERGGYLYHFTFTGPQFGLVLLGLGTLLALSFALGYVLGQDAGGERDRLASGRELPLAGPERTVELPPGARREAPPGQAGEELTFFRTLPDRPGASPPTPSAPPAAPPRAAPLGAERNPPPSGRLPVLSRPESPPIYIVQVASLREASAADAIRERLRGRGYPAYVVRADLKSKGVWYRVRVGPFRERDRAAAALGEIKLREGLPGATLQEE